MQDLLGGDHPPRLTIRNPSDREKAPGDQRLRGLSMNSMARVTGLEPATSGVTGRRSNQLSYTRADTCETVVSAAWERRA